MYTTNVFSTKTELCYGIDLGTTNSAIAVATRTSLARMIPISGLSTIMPSCISWLGNRNEFIVGEEAYKLRDKPYSVYSAKRHIGDDYKYVLRKDGKTKTMKPYEVSAEVLKGLVKKAEIVSGYKNIKNVVITVPSYFNAEQMKNTMKAAELAKLNVLKLSKEPTAAAICASQLKSNNRKEQISLVYDLGGGTFDISLIKTTKHKEGTIIDVLAIDGNDKLGGDDIDKLILDKLIAKLEKQGADVKKINSRIRENWLLQINTTKKSKGALTKFEKKIGNKNYEVSCTAEDVRLATREIVMRTLPNLDNILKQYPTITIHNVIPVGGVTKSDTVREMLEELLGELNIVVNADEAVTLGAAMESFAISNGSKDLAIRDVTPIAFSIANNNRELEVVIPKFSHIPCKRTITCPVINPNADGVKLEIYQGTGSAHKSAHIGDLYVTRTTETEMEYIDITFIVDSNGILAVTGATKDDKASSEFVDIFTLKSKEQLSIKETQIIKWGNLARKIGGEKQVEIEEALILYEANEITDKEIKKIIRTIKES